jgi:predicted nuclease of predicted toxin-antitoxin system
MPKYLIDVNLPYYFSLWKGEEYVHLRDIDDAMLDRDVWEYTKNRSMTIITKDSDFSSRIMVFDPPPRIIHLRVGNMKLNELFEFLSIRWNEILLSSQKYKLVSVYKDRIEGIQ